MDGPYLPFDRLYPYEKRPPLQRGDDDLIREYEDDFWGESPLDRLYRNGPWYYFPPVFNV